MDLDTIREVTVARERADLAGLGGGTAVLAGGTWLYSEPQDGLDRLIDISALGWEPLTVWSEGLDIAATCTLAELDSAALPGHWPAAALFAQATGALAASHKIRRTATVGGNVCLALPAGAVLAALTALGGSALVWGPLGDRWIPLSRFAIGPGQTVLAADEVVRTIRIPEWNMRSRTAFRKISLAPTGRSGAVVMGRRALSHSFHLTLSAATIHPVVLDFREVPSDGELLATINGLDTELWYDDPHGTPEWRRHVSGILATQVAADLRGARS